MHETLPGHRIELGFFAGRSRMNKIFARSLVVSLLTISSGFLMITLSASAEEVAAQTATLYERFGGRDAVNQVVRDTIAYHQENPTISHYFEEVDVEQLVAHVAAFFTAGMGGPSNYAGRDMTSTHAGMGLSDADFDSVVADVLRAIDQNGIGKTEKAEVAAILESLRPAVLGTAGG